MSVRTSSPSIAPGSLTGSMRAEGPRAPKGTRLGVWMALAIAVVAALAWYDGDRESKAAFEDFSQEQATLAVSAAADLSTRLDSIHRDALRMADDVSAGRSTSPTVLDGYVQMRVRSAEEPAAVLGEGMLPLHLSVGGGRIVDLALPALTLLREVHRIERPSDLVLLVAAPGSPSLATTDGRFVRIDRIAAAVGASQTAMSLTREEAASLGLPLRSAVAGIARIDAGPLGHWAVITVATARNERDRELRARWRLLSSVTLASGLVFVFGSIALRKQRKELELERELAVQDVQHRRDERLVRASRVAMMGTLATGVAHEIGTPLGVIAGRAEQLLARANGDERATRHLKAILEQTERISGVVRGFLDLSRGGRPTLAKVDPALIVRSAVRLVEHRFEKAKVRLRSDVPEGLPEIHCDVRLMEHAVVNLLLNGCEASPEGGTVDVLVREDRSRVAFVVVDSGAGISEEHAAQALEPFFTTKPVGQGTGLGLAITNEIVKAHRGHLSIAAADPVGTRACIEIPIAPEEVAHVDA